MRTTTIFAAAALMTVVAVAPAASAASGDYIAGGDVGAAVQCDVEPVLGACIGGQVFDVPANAVTVDIRIDDDVLADTGGFYFFSGAEDSGAFCDAASVDVPSGATSLTVVVDTAFGPLDCMSNPPGSGTTGTITAAFGVPL